MDAGVIVSFFMYMIMSNAVTLNKFRDSMDFESDTKIELKPLIISCGLGDNIIISLPILNNTTAYFLSPPTRETIQINIDLTNISNQYIKTSINNDEYNDITVKYIKELAAIITPVNRYKIFNVNNGRSCLDPIDTFADNTKELLSNDYVIGPVDEIDHGNWVLSMYTKKTDKELIELYQIITLEILETIPTSPIKPKLATGETFELSFAYPIKYLESCEITAPRSTFDRFYERSNVNFNSCGFSIPNVSKADEGLWRIVGVARIIYEATVYLEVNSKIT